jgi:multiple sugar transport system permease protein
LSGPFPAAPALPQSARRRGRLDRRALWGYVFIAPWLLGLIAFTLLPIALMFYFSLTRYSVLDAPEWVGLANFRKMLTADPLFWKALANTAYYVGLRVPLHVGLGLALAVLVNRSLPGMAFFRAAFYLPTVVPLVATIVVWAWLLDSQVGVFKYLLARIDIALPNVFAHAALVKPVMVGLSLWQVGVVMMVFLAALQDVPRELHEAAAVDGASAMTRFWRITLPLLTPAVYFNIVTDTINSFQVFALALILTRGGPLDASLFYVLYVYQHAFEFFEMGYACALAVILFLVILACTLVVVRSGNIWVHYERV